MSWAETLFLKKIIDGRKRFIPTDTILVLYTSETSGVFTSGTILGTFTPKASGIVKFIANVAEYSSSSPVGMVIIDPDGNIVASLLSDGISGSQDLSVMFEIQARKVYTISVSRGPGWVRMARICGDIIDDAMYDYEKVV